MRETVPQPPAVDCTEKEFQSWVVAVARAREWMCFHVHRVQTMDGAWRTTTPAGWPDLTMLRDGRMVVAELKARRGRTTPDQETWLDALAEVECVEVHEWRPSDWASVIATLA